MMSYPREQIYREVAYIAYHFHWSHDAVMEMEHRQRQRWIAEIARINQQINEVSEKGSW